VGFWSGASRRRSDAGEMSGRKIAGKKMKVRQDFQKPGRCRNRPAGPDDWRLENSSSLFPAINLLALSVFFQPITAEWQEN